MSLALLLAANSAPVDPPSDDFNTTWHGEHTAFMQPEWDHVIRVGPTREHTTLASGLAAAYQSPYAKPGTAPDSSNWASGVRTAFARTVVVIDPGEYLLTGDVYGCQIGQGIDLMGNGDARDDVVLRSTTPTRYTVHPWSNFYLANATIIGDETSTPVTGNNYAVHASESGTLGQRNFTAVLDNVSMIDNRASSGIFGWDMPEGLRAFLYRNRFESTTGHPITLHDSPESDVETLFLECESDTPLTVTLGSGDGTPNGKTWIVDCTELDGAPIADSTYINGVASTPPVGIPTTLPENGITTAEAAKYTPSALGTVTTYSPDFPSTTNLSGFTPGRTYYIPMTLPAVARIAGAKCHVVTAAGSVSAGMFLGKAPGLFTWGYGVYSYDAQTAVVGDNITPIQAGDSEFYLTAGTKMFLAVRVNSASCVVRASTTMAAATQCYYTDDTADPTTAGILPFPATAVALAPGQPVPWAALVTA